MVIIRIYVVALRKYCWWCHSKICCPCAAGAIVAIAIVTNGTFKQVVDSRNRWWHIEMGGVSKWVVGGQNSWWCVETGGCYDFDRFRLYSHDRSQSVSDNAQAYVQGAS